MGDTITWLNIEIVIFWLNILIMALFIIYDKYFQSMKSKVYRFNIQRASVKKEVMEFYSPDYTKHNSDKSVERRITLITTTAG